MARYFRWKEEFKGDYLAFFKALFPEHWQPATKGIPGVDYSLNAAREPIERKDESMIVKEPESAKRNIPEAGVYDGVCVDEVDLGMEANKFDPEGPDKPKVRIIWEIDAIDQDFNRRFTVAQKFTASLHEKAALRKLLEGWRGKKFTADELKGFDLENVVGVAAQIVVTHSAGQDGTIYANVNSVLPGKKKLTASKEYVRVKDRPDKDVSPLEAERNQKRALQEEVPF
jgi:hypothetical protein